MSCIFLFPSWFSSFLPSPHVVESLKTHYFRSQEWNANSWDLWCTWYVVKTWERRLQRLAPSRSTFWQTSFFSLSKLVLVVRTWAWTWDIVDKEMEISSQYCVSGRFERWKQTLEFRFVQVKQVKACWVLAVVVRTNGPLFDGVYCPLVAFL